MEQNIKKYCEELHEQGKNTTSKLKYDFENIDKELDNAFAELELKYHRWERTAGDKESDSWKNEDYYKFQENKNIPQELDNAYSALERIASEGEAVLGKDYFSVRSTWEEFEKNPVSERVKSKTSGIAKRISGLGHILHNVKNEAQKYDEWVIDKKGENKKNVIIIIIAILSAILGFLFGSGFFFNDPEYGFNLASGIVWAVIGGLIGYFVGGGVVTAILE